MRRREFLKSFVSCITLVISGVYGVLKPVMALADWNKEAFSAVTENDAVSIYFSGQSIAASDAITIGVYDFVENGAVVPVKIESGLAGIESVTILVEKNPNPLIASFNLGPGCQGLIATRIKMDQSSDIIAVVKSEGKLYSTRKYVEVLAGGCG